MAKPPGGLFLCTTLSFLFHTCEKKPQQLPVFICGFRIRLIKTKNSDVTEKGSRSVVNVDTRCEGDLKLLKIHFKRTPAGSWFRSWRPVGARMFLIPPAASEYKEALSPSGVPWSVFCRLCLYTQRSCSHLFDVCFHVCVCVCYCGCECKSVCMCVRMGLKLCFTLDYNHHRACKE